MRPFKIVVVGVYGCGKTALLNRYLNNKFSNELIETTVEKYSKNISIDGQSIALDLWDTSGHEKYEDERGLAYSNANLILLCLAVDNSSKVFSNIKDKWIPEIRDKCPALPIILVGTRSDLRRESQTNLINYRDCLELAKVIGAIKYLECSALTGQSVDNVFEDAVKSILKRKSIIIEKKSKKCLIF